VTWFSSTEGLFMLETQHASQVGNEAAYAFFFCFKTN
jgi:hypothetical protein